MRERDFIFSTVIYRGILLLACLLLCSLAGQSHSLHKIFWIAGACKTGEINFITSHTPTPLPHILTTAVCSHRYSVMEGIATGLRSKYFLRGIFITLFMNIHWLLPTRQWAPHGNGWNVSHLSSQDVTPNEYSVNIYTKGMTNTYFDKGVQVTSISLVQWVYTCMLTYKWIIPSAALTTEFKI